ncbi:MAG TPA: HNH endonuclease [Atribacter sp.]|uniref:HNH endonuclease n=1 Tax=Atribacter sp. TaxID=2847780 RepID=UPI002BC73FA3|nr:HNH endonuclease [Atribacter sp.]HOT05760.1 HNH endonuclease [Atribacter sp.]HQK84045.1 HNH endonuclease [Atribacter sp.]
MSRTIRSLILEFFYQHPKQDLEHGPVVDWVTEQHLKENTTPPRDIWRTVRHLHQEGILIKVNKGVYRYDPEQVTNRELFDFSEETKEAILQRDQYQCVVCGRGRKDGVELCVDHIKPKDKGGDNSIENGQTLCTEHNLLKKNYTQTEAGKRYFIKIYKQAVANNDIRMINFCKGIFDVYDTYKLNGHIKRPNGKE